MTRTTHTQASGGPSTAARSTTPAGAAQRRDQNAAQDAPIPARLSLRWHRAARGNYSPAGPTPRPDDTEGGRCAGEAPVTTHEPVPGRGLPGDLLPTQLPGGVTTAGPFCGDMLAALRLALLTDIHKAKRAHKPTAGLRAKLRRVTAGAMA